MAQVKKRPWEGCQWFGLGYKWRRIRDRRDVGTRGEQKEKTTERDMGRERNLGPRPKLLFAITVARNNSLQAV